MGLVPRDALRRLCIKIGWSYAVFWRTVGLQEQRYLIWEDGYCEGKPGGVSGFEAMDLCIKEKGFLTCSDDERLTDLGSLTEDIIYMLVHKKMVTQVHIEGNGVVGNVALTAIHKWILHGNLDKNYPTSKVDLQDLVEMNQQLLAGIHTIAVIPVLPYGVLQLGSTQLIFEEVGFATYVQHLFMQTGSMTRAYLYDVRSAALNLNHNLQPSDSIQPCFSQCGVVSNNVSAIPLRNCRRRENPLFIGDDSRFITRSSPEFTSLLNKVSVFSQQMSLNNDISRKRTLPSTNFLQSSCHVVNPNHYPNKQVKSGYVGHAETSVSNSRLIGKPLPDQPACLNDSLSPDHLEFLENQFRIHLETTLESADNHVSLMDNSELLHMRTHESKLSLSHNGCERASSFSRSDSSNKSGNVANTTNSSGVMESTVSKISLDNEVSQNPSLTDDSFMLYGGGFSCTHSYSIDKKSITMSSIDEEKHGNEICESFAMPMTELDVHASDNRLEHSSNPDGWWYDSSLDSINKQDSNGSHALAICVSSAACENNEMLPPPCIKISSDPHKFILEKTLFDLSDLDQVPISSHSFVDDSFITLNSAGVNGKTISVPASLTQTDVLNDKISCSGRLLSESGSDQLLDAVVSQVKTTCKLIPDDNVPCNAASANTSHAPFDNNSLSCGRLGLSEQLSGYFVGQPSNTAKSHHSGANSIKSACNIDRSEGTWSFKDDKHKSQINEWYGKAQSMNSDAMSAANCKGVDEVGKLNRKRFRAGENPRPRPKDRQMIQDRVKELREIVPSGAKMSIDALLEKTIKHMLFLQSIAKHADKLKENEKPKMISEVEGSFLKENFEGSATWALEVGSQSLIYPIVVEDLSTPRHMLVEMLCEKNGFFLEIADSIRSLGLTILKGVMETRENKVWARFTVEANRDVTRMEVFLYLLHLLEPTPGNTTVFEGLHNCKIPDNVLCHSTIPLTGTADCL